MRAISIFLFSLLLLACSPSGSGGGVVGGGMDSPVVPPGGVHSSAAQPLDPGFSGPSKDVDSLGYLLKDLKGRTLCKEADGDYRVRLNGKILHQTTLMPITGFLRISDLNAQRHLVTKVANEGEGETGTFSVAMKIRIPHKLTFGMLQGENFVLDTLLPNEEEGMVFIVRAEPQSELIIEGLGNPSPCVYAQDSNSLAPVWGGSEGESEGEVYVPNNPLQGP